MTIASNRERLRTIDKPRDARKVPERIWRRMVQAAQAGTAWPIVLLGRPGSGKTCAGLALLDFAVGQRRYLTIAEACEELIDAQHDRLSRGDYELGVPGWWRWWRDLEIAVLDELGARERVSDHHYEVVHRLLDYRERKPLIVISNLPLVSDDGANLRDLYDERLVSRLAAGTVINFSGADRRVSNSQASARGAAENITEEAVHG